MIPDGKRGSASPESEIGKTTKSGAVPESEIEKILKSGAADLGLELDGAGLRGFTRYADYLAGQNAVMNLTAIEGETDIARLHFLDCMALLRASRFDFASVIDVGAGAGFPGVVLKLAGADIRLTLLDAQKKRVDFLTRLCGLLGLDGVECLHMRAEEASESMRESFDFAVSRAVAELRMLCELALPFVRIGGAMIAMKGPRPDEELDLAKNAVAVLGGEFEDIFTYIIPGTDIVHSAVIIRKTQKTPLKYPRRFARIQKNPL